MLDQALKGSSQKFRFPDGCFNNGVFDFGQAIYAANDGISRSTSHGPKNEPDAKSAGGTTQEHRDIEPVKE